ncbi:MAG: Rhs family protein [Fibrobacteres bacterium]|nr:Rhs family protein [Fibrobacterota bacterium]
MTKLIKIAPGFLFLLALFTATPAHAASVLLVVDEAGMWQGDSVMKVLAEELGHTVTVSTPPVTVSQASGKDLILVSSTYSPDLDDGFRTVAIPILNWSVYEWEDMALVESGNTSSDASAKRIKIIDSTHAMAAGQHGLDTIASSNNDLDYAIPTSSAQIVATRNGSPGLASIWGYEAGAAMAYGYNAPARRAGTFVYNNGPTKLNTAGRNLMKAAMTWCLAGSVDTTPPVVHITSPANGKGFTSSPISVAWTADGVTQTSQLTETLTEGSNKILRTATDGSGNTGKDSITVVLDTHGPTVVITSPANGYVTNQASATIAWTVDGATQTIQLTASLSVGSNNIVRSATDSLGNLGKDSITIVRDTVAPVVVITSPAADQLYNVSSISVAWTVDGVTQTGQTTETLSADGAHNVIRSATDAAGNVGADTVRVFRDMTAPVVAITSPADGGITNQTFTVVAWTVDGMNQTLSGTYENLDAGDNFIIRTATDSAGNVGRDTIRFVCDNVPPVIALISPNQSAVVVDTSVDIHWSIDGVSQTPIHHHMDSGEVNIITLTAADAADNHDTLNVSVYAGIYIPDLIGRTYFQADSLLHLSALGKDSSWVDNDTVPTGQVFAQSPVAGDSLPYHFLVHYKISRGTDAKDLTPTSLATKDMTVNPVSLESGGFVRLAVANLGRTAVEDSFSLVVFEDRNRDLRFSPDTDLYLGRTTNIDPIEAGDTAVFDIAVSGGLTFNGNRISAVADYANAIAETDEGNNAIQSMAQCRKLPLTVNYTPILKWEWVDSIGAGSEIAINTPLVAHLTDDNGDGKYDSKDIPEILVATIDNGDGGHLIALNGRDGHEVWRKAGRVNWPSVAATGDIDGDGSPEVVFIESRTNSWYRRLLILDNMGNRKDSCDWQFFGSIGFGIDESVTMSDLDGDGKAELIWGQNIFDHRGRLIYPKSFYKDYHSLQAADLDGDGYQELVGLFTLPTNINRELSIFDYRSKTLTFRSTESVSDVPLIGRVGTDPRILSPFAEGPDSIGGAAIFNPSLDSVSHIPSIQFVHPGFMIPDYLTDHFFFGKDSARIMFAVGSTIGDQGRPYFSRTNLRDSSVSYWLHPHGVDGSAFSARGTVFDFADDDNPKVVLETDDSIFIQDSSGAILGKVRASGHRWTTGITMADADNDGHADIVAVSAFPDSSSLSRVAVYSNPTWVGARTLYNQNGYTVTNINDDGTIPRFPTPSWQANNTVNIQCTEGHYACVDMTASLPQFVQDTAGHDTLTARIGNGGALTLPAGIPVTLYAGHLGAETKLVTLNSPQRLEAGEYYTFRYPVADSVKGAFSFRFAADDSGHGNGGLDEIDEINNSVVLSIMVNNLAPVVTAPGHRYAEPATAFLDTLHAIDSDGDSVTFRLAKAPLGMTLDAHTGILSWMPPDSLPRCTVTVAVSDPYQATTMASLLIYIGNAANHPPHIVSTPDTVVLLNTIDLPISHAYRYIIQASDTDGEALEYDARCLNCEGHSGSRPELTNNRISWIPFQPIWSAEDSLIMRVTVTDARGGIDSQTFTLRLTDPEVSGNHPPGFVSTPPTTVVAGADYRYVVKAADADGDAITYFLNAAPDDMTVSGGVVQWHTPPTPGATADVELTVSDVHSAQAHQFWHIALVPDVIPPGLNVSFSQNPVQPGHSVTVTVHALDNVGVASMALSQDGSPVTLTSGQYTFTPADSGDYAFAASADDTSGNVGHATSILRVTASADNTPPTVSVSHSPTDPDAGDLVTFTVDASDDVALDTTRMWVKVDGVNLVVHDGEAQYTALRPGSFTAKVAAYDLSGNSALGSDAFYVSPLGADTTAPTAELISPAEDSVVYSRVNVLGTAYDAHLAYYTLSYREVGTTTWVEFSRSTSAVQNNKLGLVDATTLVNGDYEILLSVYDRSGNSNSKSTQVHVTGEKKVGNFSLSFQDLSVPMAGMDLSVTRAYDSRVKTQGDFGIGWKMGLRSITLNENRNQGTEWSVDVSFGFIPHFDINPQKAHTVSITLPGGRKQEFTAVPQFFSQFDPSYGTMTYQAKPGTYSKLEAMDVGDFIVVGGDLYDVDGDFESSFNPQLYKLTLLDGSYFVIDQDEGGVTESGDANGNKIEWDSAFVSHSAGNYIDFSRDDEGRVTGITDGAGRSVQYVYDVLGNLGKVVDPNGNTTLFKYGPDSYLTDIVDARGVRANRTEYDDDGRIVRQINAEGDTLLMNHDIDHNLEEVLDFNGHVTSYGYDLHGNVTRKMDDAGNSWFYSYDLSDNLLSTLSPDGTLKNSTYDADGNELSSTDEMGHLTTRSYNAQGKPETVTDALGRTTEYVYDGAGNLVQETGPDGTVQSQRTYDAHGNVLTEKDALGHTTTHTYNSLGWLLSATDPLSHTQHFGHDGAGNVLFEVNAAGDTTHFAYDNNGNRVAEVNAFGDSVKTEYNAINKVVKRIDALGHVTLSVYDNLGDKIADTAADTTVTSRTYDAQGNVASITDAVGRTTHMQYDFENRLIKTTFPDMNYTTTTYDALGRRIRAVDANGNATEYGYDDAGRNISVTDALGHITQYEYDEAGRKTSMIDALGHRIDYAYDDYDRLTVTTYPDATTRSITYDDVGRKTAETDPMGFTTHFYYDNAGNLTAVKDAAGDSTSYTYDENNNRLTQKDANNHTTSMAYDLLNRMVSRTYPNGNQERWTYNSNGAMLSHVKGMDSTAYAYDVMDREVYREHFNSGHTVATTYTLDGKRETVVDHRGTSTFSYDNRSRLAGEGHPNGDSLENHYDAQGNRTSVVTPFGTTHYTYDVLNRMASVVSPQSKTTTYHYDAVGNRDSVVSPNGTTSGYQYDALNRLARVRHYKAGTILAHYAYALNAAGIRTQVTEKDSSKVFFAYDSLYRLKSERRTGNHTDTMTYTYDPVGNRSTKGHRGVTTNYAYNNRDQLLSEWDGTDSTLYAYDSVGRMLTKAEAGGTTHYRWRDEDRLDSLYGPGVSVKYQYDADGQRVKDSTGSTVRQYLIDPLLPYGQVIAETDGSNSLVSEYVAGLDRVSLRRSGAVHYYLADGQGSTRLLTDSTGTVTDSTVYTAFGETLFSSGSTPNNFLYTGEQFDASAGLYNLRARLMDPRVGRFASVDPYEGDPEAPISLHRYLYAGASPSNFVDPTGEVFIGELLLSISVSSILINVGATINRSAATKIPLSAYSADNDVQQTIGITFAESGTVSNGGESIDEQVAIAATVINRVWYSTWSKQNRRDFGGTVGAVISKKGEYLAYGGDRWNLVMSGSSLKTPEVLSSLLKTNGDRLHFNNVVSAVPTDLSLPIDALGGYPIWFQKGSTSPSKDRAEYLGKIGLHNFWGLVDGREAY